MKILAKIWKFNQLIIKWALDPIKWTTDPIIWSPDSII